MSNVAKLKKQAAELEAKKQFDKALAIYIKLLDSFDQNASELDVALFNRVGDLLLRQGNVADAVDYYEKAVDRYGETGFFNNAIALCNKILRHSPGRTSIYYKLGKISAQKGFKNDAKVNFLEYADRMQKGGKVDEAFRALKEFADLCPDQDEIRLMLAEQLTKADRKTEAIEQLQLLHERYDSEGRASEAAATASRMRTIDPTVEPRSSGGGGRKTTSGDLIFIDLDSPSLSGSYVRQQTPLAPISRVPEPNSALTSSVDPELEVEQEPEALATLSADLPLIDTGDVFSGSNAGTIDDSLVDVMKADDSLDLLRSTPSASILGFEPTAVDEPLSFTPTPLSSPSIEEPLPPTPVSSAIVEEPTPAPIDAGATPVDSEAIDPPAFVEDSLAEPTFDAPTIEEVRIDEPASMPTPMFNEPLMPDPALAVGLGDDFSDPLVVHDVMDEPLGLPVPADEPPTPSIPSMATPLSADAISSIDGLPDPLEEFGPEGDGRLFDADVELGALDSPAASAEDASIDFDVSSLTTPSKPASPPLRPTPATPATTRVALEGLPLMALEVPEATVPVSAEEEHSALTLSSDLELVEDPGLSMMSDLMGRASVADDSLLDLGSDVTMEDEESTIPTPSVARRSTVVAEHSVEILRASVEGDLENWSLRREFAEAMLEAGLRDEGIRELETAMNGADRAGDLDLASSLAEEIARLEPEVVRHHQKRVEYAFRTNDRSRLTEAYVSLADALLASDQADKAQTVYQRVLDLAPDDVRARAGIDSLAMDEPEHVPEPPVSRPAAPSKPAPSPAAAPAPRPSSDFVNLGDWLRDSEAPRDTRMVVAEQEPTGDEAADFADMLRKFKQGVAENVDPEDYQSHYDLAIAFKEMGLLDEAIAEFQKALGSPTNRLPTYEALGQCFLEKAQYKLASSILSRALNERASEEQLVGVLYLLGRAAEAQGLTTDAVNYYQRVFVLDIQFRDAADRLSELERVAR